jgi:2-methylcitrate dehydratase PrpD
MGLSPSSLADACAIATHTASGLNEWSNAGTDEHVFQIGFAARNGLLAAELARAGAVAAPSILDGPAGLLAAFGARERSGALLERPRGDFAILKVVHKPAPACFFVQTPSQVAEQLAGGSGLDPATIEAVEIRTSRAAAVFPGCDNPGPMTSRQNASMSIQFCVASVLANGAIRPRNWGEYRDPAVNALAARCRVVADDRFTAASPGRSGASVEVFEVAGGRRSAEAEDFRSMTAEEVEQRFLRHAGAHLGEDRAREAAEQVMCLETLPDLAALAALLVPTQSS